MARKGIFLFVLTALALGLVCSSAAHPDGLQLNDNDNKVIVSDRLLLDDWTTTTNTGHRIVPSLYHGVHKTPIQSTAEENGLHVSHLTLKYQTRERKEVTLDLQLNQELIPEGHFIHYQLPEGKGYAQQNFTLHDVDHCHYKGHIRGRSESTAAISTCDGVVHGVVFDGEETFYIHATTTNGSLGAESQSEHFLVHHPELDFTNKTCGYEGTQESSPDGAKNHHHHLHHHTTEFNRMLRYKRSTGDTEKVRGPFNANRDSSYVELMLVVDNKVYQAMDNSLRRVHNHCKTITNIINAVYTPLNIFIALIGVVVWNEQNEVELSSDGDKTLKNFLHYRRKTLVKVFPNDNAQLLTREQFDGGVVGKALKGPICTYEFSGGVSMDHSEIVAVVATTVAHEIGHNFGMEHDTADCKCEDERCIMSASSSSVAPKHWSSCSIDQLNLAFHQGMNYCLRNKPKSLFDSPQCGNGFVEPGEQCDCGLPSFCKNTCCDPYTCMLYKNASCATGSCCDMATCRPRKAGTMCRSVNGECDLPEYCTGESEFCPNDVFKRDTVVCGKGRAFCYEGACRSRTDQCRVLWGISGNSSDECYSKNENGSRHGNCGYDRLANEYVKCRSEDVYCGMLHCRHTNEKLEFGMENVAVLSHSFLNHENRIVACRTAIVDLGLESTDPGLTPNGAKCGENKMCVDQKCLAIEQVVRAGKGTPCENDCNGRGVCNSEGHCHCDSNFAPPDCMEPGPGGSVDSGPSRDPHVGTGFAMFLIIVCGVVIPLCFAIFCYFYCRRQNGDRFFVFKRPFNIPKPVFKLSPSSKASSPMSGSTNLSNGPGKSLPTSPDDMNASLLRQPSTDEAAVMNNNMFGKFKGFTMRPLQDTPAVVPTSPHGPNVAFVQPVSKAGGGEGEKSSANSKSPAKSTVRAAPAVPKVPKLSAVGRSQSQSVEKKEKKTGMAKIGRAKTVVGDAIAKFDTSEPPALPPLNPGAHPRPLISSPILESSTSTAKEMGSPLQNGKNVVPIRPAPKVEQLKTGTKGDVEVDFAMKPLPAIENKGGTLKRIKSLMKKEETPLVTPVPTSNSAKQHERKVPKFIDRNRLKTIEISAPIPQLETQTEINNRKSVLARTHSMRKESPTEEAAQKQQLLSFGSTRSVTRPKSIVTGRPKSPPPPRPPAPAGVEATAPPPPVPKDYITTPMDSYQRPPAPKKVGFVDPPAKVSKSAPLASEDSSAATSPDNIYAVIDEDRLTGAELKSSAGDTSMESLGLLGEIVNEMENRNLGSIYSTAGAGARRTNGTEGPQYANAEEVLEEDVKSNISTTSSGYLKPISAVKPVVAGAAAASKASSGRTGANEENKSQPYKSYHASINRPFASQYSVPKGKGGSAPATGAAAAGSSVKKEEEAKARKPQTPVKPVLKGKGSDSEGGTLSQRIRKFETATNKK